VTDAGQQPRPKRRRRLLGWLIAGGVLVVLLVVGFVVAENVVRAQNAARLHDEIVTAFGLDADHPTRIDFGPGSLLLQAVSGKVDEVDIAVDDVPFGDITADVAFSARGVALDAANAADSVSATATLDETDVGSLRDYLSGIRLDSITLGDGTIDVSTTVDALFLSVPVSASITPSAAGGDLVFTPTSVTVNGAVVSIDDLRSGPLGGIASRFLGSQSFCVAQYLPAAISLDDVTVADDAVVLSFEGEKVRLGGSDLSAKGSCG